jgi:hypothetical protein
MSQTVSDSRSSPNEESVPWENRLAQLESAISTLSAQIAQIPTPAQAPDVTNVARGPELPRVLIPASPQIAVRNRRYSQVLSVDAYRLQDRTTTLRDDQLSGLTGVSNQIRPRLEGCLFGGCPPLSVLPFLLQLTRVADQSHITEATLLWIVEDFLLSPVKESFRSQRFNSWPTAVHWLLSTYASEQSLEIAVRDLQTTSQLATESVREFGSRLQLHAVSLGSLLSSAEIKALFAQGLNDPVRSLFVANQPSHELDDASPVSILVARAELLETGTRSAPLPSSRAPVRPSVSRQPVLAVSEQSQEAPPATEDAFELLALEARSGPAHNSQWICFVCFKQGHGWLECPLLQHVPMAEKEEIVLRRRQYLDRRRPRSPAARIDSTWPRSLMTRGQSPDDRREAHPPSPKNDQAPPRRN